MMLCFECRELFAPDARATTRHHYRRIPAQQRHGATERVQALPLLLELLVGRLSHQFTVVITRRAGGLAKPESTSEVRPEQPRKRYNCFKSINYDAAVPLTASRRAHFVRRTKITEPYQATGSADSSAGFLPSNFSTRRETCSGERVLRAINV